ncbi:ThiF family adenylyltransferase [Pusillimonas sp.]|uniref:tRNA threonylcarbamoyladenosine dehydratase n=1 Tax=Pusillimonas sp. TaxID=3040095 RepID=UPI0037C897ED
MDISEADVGAGPGPDQADLERRFGGLERLYGPETLRKLAGAHVAVAGIGGVGSWCAEALARSGVGRLTLVDMDHVAESNVNRQLHALTETLGQSKVNAMAARVRGINPHCGLHLIDDFVTPENVADVLAADLNVLIDCTDQASAKIAMILEARRRKLPIVVCGGAGGKTNVLALRAGDLSTALNDALLAKLRNTLRRHHGYPKGADANGKALKRVPRMGVRALWFDQPAILPEQWTDTQPRELGGVGLQGLSCAGYGSAVAITGSMGMAAAAEAIHFIGNGKFAV